MVGLCLVVCYAGRALMLEGVRGSDIDEEVLKATRTLHHLYFVLRTCSRGTAVETWICCTACSGRKLGAVTCEVNLINVRYR